MFNIGLQYLQLMQANLVFDLFSLKWRLMRQMLQGILKQFNDHNEHYLKSSCQWKVSILIRGMMYLNVFSKFRWIELLLF